MAKRNAAIEFISEEAKKQEKRAAPEQRSRRDVANSLEKHRGADVHTWKYGEPPEVMRKDLEPSYYERVFAYFSRRSPGNIAKARAATTTTLGTWQGNEKAMMEKLKALYGQEPDRLDVLIPHVHLGPNGEPPEELVNLQLEAEQNPEPRSPLELCQNVLENFVDVQRQPIGGDEIQRLIKSGLAECSGDADALLHRIKQRYGQPQLTWTQKQLAGLDIQKKMYSDFAHH